ncbi:MAG TPA: uroporphyrinogen-III synthase, partial [Candidatus Deferrimicrobium sp.]|nr:uroporphyrinogen-III synthase [Candidatus Deferrimicrobium sp.]
MTAGRPLEGRRVVVTRGLDKADQLPGLLEQAGAAVARVPLIEPVPLVGAAEVAAAVRRLGERTQNGTERPWLVLTSESGVSLVADAVGPAGLSTVAVAAVGPATAAALRARGVDAALVASGQEAASLAAELAARGVRGARVLV